MMLICFGTRPDYIKIKPILDVFKGEIPYKILFTGQHTSLLPPVEDNIHRLYIKDGPNRLDSIVASVLNNEDIFKNVTSVMVQGDTTSAFAIAFVLAPFLGEILGLGGMFGMIAIFSAVSLLLILITLV